MSLIDNQNIYLKDELADSLKEAESIDIITGFFYFSGFKLLSDECDIIYSSICIRVIDIPTYI